MEFDHRVASAWLLNNGKVLLQKRDKDAKINPGGWGSFGGHIESGETPEQAVLREILEDLQIVIKPNYYRRYVYTLKEGQFERFVFIVESSYSEEELRNLQKEGDDLGYFSADGAKKLLQPHNQNIIDDMVKSNLLPKQ